jgi:hypothetical protein
MDGAVEAVRSAGCWQATLWVLEHNGRAPSPDEPTGLPMRGKDTVVAGVPVTKSATRTCSELLQLRTGIVVPLL